MRRDSLSLGDLYDLMKKVAEETVEEKLADRGSPEEDEEEERPRPTRSRAKGRADAGRDASPLDALATVLMTVAETQQEILRTLREQHHQQQETTVRVLEAMGTVLQQLKALPSGGTEAETAGRRKEAYQGQEVPPPPTEQPQRHSREPRTGQPIPTEPPRLSRNDLLAKMADYLEIHLGVVISTWEPAQVLEVLGQSDQVYVAEGSSDGRVCRVVALVGDHISATDVSVFYNRTVRELLRTLRTEVLAVVVGQTLEPRARRSAIYYGFVPLTVPELNAWVS